MKILLLLFAFTNLLLPVDENMQQFDNQVKDGYESYIECENYENNYFRVKVIQGINQNDVTLGIFLFNNEAKTNTVVVTINEKDYTLSSNNRGDYIIPAVKIESDAKIRIVDEAGHDRHIINITAYDVSSFKSTYPNALSGNNTGATLSTVKETNAPMPTINLLMIIFGSIIVVFGLIILLLFITKKGMFNKETRMSNVFNFKEFAQSLYSQKEKEQQSSDDIVLDKKDYQEVKEEPTPIINMYPYQREYEDDDEVDVLQILKNKGFNTNYDIATTQEKNEVMLELMKMRDYHEISKEQYQKEVVKLWRK